MPCHRAFEPGGQLAGVMEAIGGIFYAWRLESRAVQACLTEQSGVPVDEFKMVVDVLGSWLGTVQNTQSRSSSYNNVLEPSAAAAKSIPMRQAFQHKRVRCLLCSPARLAQGQPFAGPLQAPRPRQSGWSVAMSQPSMQQAVPAMVHEPPHPYMWGR